MKSSKSEGDAFQNLYPKQAESYNYFNKKGHLSRFEKYTPRPDTVEELEVMFRGDLTNEGKNGSGEAMLDDRTLIVGEFKGQKLDGEVGIVSPTGYTFSGKVLQAGDEDGRTIKGEFYPPLTSNSKLPALQRGIGMVFGDDGTEYSGAFLYGLRNGFGIENDKTKNWRFEGFWKDDKKHGEGFMYKHGVVYWQKYEEGLLKTEKKVSNTTI